MDNNNIRPVTSQQWSDEDPVMVSIAVAAYNHEAFIRQAIESFLIQETNFRVEILMNDDASTDNTAQIIKEYEIKYPRLFKNYYQTENQYSKGKKPWVNVLFPNASGKYIAICEGDDYWVDPFKLQDQIVFLENNMDYVLVGGYAKKIYESESYQIIHDKPVYKEDFDFDTGFLFLQNPLSTLTVCFRNKLVNQFPEVYFKGSGSDRRLYMLLAQYGKCKYKHKAYGVYRIHGGGVTNKYKGSVSAELNGLRESINNAKNWNAHFEFKYEKEARKVIGKLAERAVKLSLKNGLVKDAISFSDEVILENVSAKMRFACSILRLLK